MTCSPLVKLALKDKRIRVSISISTGLGFTWIPKCAVSQHSTNWGSEETQALHKPIGQEGWSDMSSKVLQRVECNRPSSKFAWSWRRMWDGMEKFNRPNPGFWLFTRGYTLSTKSRAFTQLESSLGFWRVGVSRSLQHQTWLRRTSHCHSRHAVQREPTGLRPSMDRIQSLRPLR